MKITQKVEQNIVEYKDILIGGVFMFPISDGDVYMKISRSRQCITDKNKDNDQIVCVNLYNGIYYKSFSDDADVKRLDAELIVKTYQ